MGHEIFRGKSKSMGACCVALTSVSGSYLQDTRTKEITQGMMT